MTLESADTPIPPTDFLADLTTVLIENHYEGLLGLNTIGKHNWAEVSIGQASVVVPTNGENNFNLKDFVDVSFTFDADQSGFRVHGKCGGGGHDHTGKPKPMPEPKQK
ncbi:hypothetical protein ACHAPI_002462 [Fusarium lateritium]